MVDGQCQPRLLYKICQGLTRSGRKVRMIQQVKSKAVWTAVFIFTFLVSLTCLAFLLLPGGRKITLKLIKWWARWTLKLAGVKHEVIGIEKIPEGRPVVYVANHQSTLDIPVCMAVLPGRVRMMAKHTLFKIPVFGWVLHAEGFVPVNRNDRKKARLSLGPAATRLKKGVSIFVFPAGTRSRTGEVGTFKTGGYRLAIEAGVPIVPLALVGAEDLLAAARSLIKKGKITLIVGEAIETEGLKLSDRTRLRDETWQWISETKKIYSASP